MKLKIYNVEQVGKILQLTPEAVRDYLRKKRIIGQKIGIRWYVSEKNMMKFVNNEK